MTGDAAAPGLDGENGVLTFDTTVAHQARVYNYVLGGKDHYAADRAAARCGGSVNQEALFSPAPRGRRRGR
jgi:hypothetical protein